MRGLIAAVLAVAATAAHAQPGRSPSQRQTLLEIAFVLGEAHALRTACRGPEDQTWRARMTGLMEVEQADEAFRRVLVERFNAGYGAGEGKAPSCRPGTPEQEREAARRGERLAATLAQGR